MEALHYEKLYIYIYIYTSFRIKFERIETYLNEKNDNNHISLQKFYVTFILKVE